MKKRFAMLIVSALLILSVSGCGEVDEATSAAVPESAREAVCAVDSTTTSTEKAPQTENLPSYSTTYRCPLTSRITTRTSFGSTNANCTYPMISFTVGAAVRERDEVFTEDFRGQVVTSKAQLDALGLDEAYGTDEYTENYFEDKVLVVLEFRLTSGSTQLRVDTVWTSGDTMWVRYTTLHPNPSTGDMAYRRILLEICQKSADGIKHVVGERVPIHLPSGSPPNPTAL